jgi:acetoin utilization deacetylase AcuC-like enzyme
MGHGHPECGLRLDAIVERLMETGLEHALVHPKVEPASENDLLLAHSFEHVQYIKSLHEALKIQALHAPGSLSHIDPDTWMNVHTWDACLYAVGAILGATRAVISGELENAFCAVRPPGHHAERKTAMGFCFFNNVAIAVNYALNVAGLSRVAVIDFDVHHGNGTEDILAGDSRALMLGFYQHPLYPYKQMIPTPANIKNFALAAFTKPEQIRELVQQLWLPELDAFEPEMIFISAGFDGHRDDELGQLLLRETDYAWMTREIKSVAKRYAKGRIVSTLEGGYNPRALALSVESHLRVLADLEHHF